MLGLYVLTIPCQVQEPYITTAPEHPCMNDWEEHKSHGSDDQQPAPALWWELTVFPQESHSQLQLCES